MSYWDKDKWENSFQRPFSSKVQFIHTASHLINSWDWAWVLRPESTQCCYTIRWLYKGAKTHYDVTLKSEAEKWAECKRLGKKNPDFCQFATVKKCKKWLETILAPGYLETFFGQCLIYRASSSPEARLNSPTSCIMFFQEVGGKILASLCSMKFYGYFSMKWMARRENECGPCFTSFPFVWFFYSEGNGDKCFLVRQFFIISGLTENYFSWSSTRQVTNVLEGLLKDLVSYAHCSYEQGTQPEYY